MNNDLKFRKPKKCLGQHFLVDERTVEKILDLCELTPEDLILEIGPGRGILTKRIASKVKQLIAVEKDKNLTAILQSNLSKENLIILNADFLKYSFQGIQKKIKIIGNIPYNISSAIIEKIINNRSKIYTAFIMVQLEFGRRLVAKPGSKDYGALSCFVQYYASPKLLRRIKNTCFYPKPKIHSSFLRIDLFEKVPHPARHEQLLFFIIQKAFQQRRKTLRNALAPILQQKKITNLFENVNINPSLRAENLTLKNFIQIANYLYNHPGWSKT